MEFFTQLALIFLGLFLVFLNGFFVASEFSIVKVRATRIEELVRSGSGLARRAQSVIQKMDEYLSATQLGITISSLGLGWIGEPAFSALFEPIFHHLGDFGVVMTHTLAVSCAFFLITFLHIVLGELAPKSMAIRRPEKILLWVSGPLSWFYKILYPFTWALNGTANVFLRLLGVVPLSETDRAHSEEELRLILADSQEKGVLDSDEGRLLERVFDFGDRSVRQVMVPSIEVVFLNTQKSVEENLNKARENKHTRYPLCDGSLDKVVGIIHVKDLFWKHRQMGKKFTLEAVKRPVSFVPSSKYIKFLLTEFRQARSHLAVVVNEYGATIGIVTLEDILEELVGEIQDEFDVEVPPPMIQKILARQYMVHGRSLLEDVEQELSILLDDTENDTIAGHVMMLLGRTAQVGDEVLVAERYQVRVVGMKGLQITDLLFHELFEKKE
jgi:CBS domain containing-hemolysin-like protein